MSYTRPKTFSQLWSPLPTWGGMYEQNWQIAYEKGREWKPTNTGKWTIANLKTVTHCLTLLAYNVTCCFDAILSTDNVSPYVTWHNTGYSLNCLLFADDSCWLPNDYRHCWLTMSAHVPQPFILLPNLPVQVFAILYTSTLLAFVQNGSHEKKITPALTPDLKPELTPATIPNYVN